MRWQFYFAFISDLGRSGEGEPDLYNITEKIEISGLQVRYGENQALKGITFSVYEKEIVGITGQDKELSDQEINKKYPLFTTARANDLFKIRL